MNKHLYRIVFNDTRGQLMVVAETVTGDGKSASGGRQDERRAAPFWAILRALSCSLFAALGLAVCLPPTAHAQIVAYRNAPGNQQPTVLSAGNGVPLVNIQTPSSAGVSRNSYSQFDVQSAGAILNNARTSAQTLLGGWVQGNPWLATGSARVILNEIVSTNPSLLRGYVEVAGSAAQVVVANPAGVTCAGCGFINANRATLTTGTPIVTGGSLDGYRVEGGMIRVEGAGMDASRVDYTDLIARAVEVNAGVWAKDLKVTAGANQVDTANVQATPIAGSGAAPVFAIDVGQLGGMYANKIMLVGTEVGVGVRNAGTIGAAAGEVVVSADGKLVNPGTLISGDQPLTVSARGIDNAGTLSSEQDLTLTSAGDVVNSGLIHAGRELSLDSAGQLTNRQGTLEGQRLAINAERLANDGGTLRQNGTQALAVSAGQVGNAAGALIGNVVQTGGGSVVASGDSAAPAVSTSITATPTTSGNGAVAVVPATTARLADGLIKVRGAIDNSGTITASGAVSLNASAGLANAGTLTLNRLDASGNTIRNSGAITTTSARLAAPLLDNRGGTLLVAGQLEVAAHDVVNAQGTIRHSGADALSVALAGNLDNRGGQIASNGIDLKLSAAAIDNTGGRIEHAGDGTLSLATNRLDGNGGHIESRGALVVAAADAALDGASTLGRSFAISAGTISNKGGSITQTGRGNGSVAVAGRFDNSAGSVASTGSLSITAGEGDNSSGGKIAANGDLTLTTTSGALANDGGTVNSQRRIDARIAGEVGNASGQLVGGTDLALTAGGRVNNAGGTLGAVTGSLDATIGGALNNSGGLVEAGTGLAVSSNGLSNVSGTLLGQSVAIDTRQQTFDNSRGTVSAGGTLSVLSGTLTNVAGRLQAAGALTVDSHGQAIANTGGGNILGQSSVALTAGALDNAAGVIGAGEALTLNAASLINRTGRITENGVASGPITVAGQFDNTGGTLASAAALALTAGEIDNRGGGKIAANGDLTLTATTGALANDGGTISSLGRLDARLASELGNASGHLVGGTDLTLTTGGRVDNAGGTLGAVAGSLDAAIGGALDNSGGRVEAATSLTLTSNALTNVSGTVLGQSVAIDSRQQSFDNSRGTVSAGGTLSVASGTLTNAAGRLQAAGALTVDSHGQAIANTGGGNILGQSSVALTAGALDNTSGVIGAGEALTLNAASLINRAGRITQNGTVSGPITVAGQFDNTGGTLASAAALALTAGEIDNRSGGKIAANGDLTLTTTTGALANDGGTVNSLGGIDAHIAGEVGNASGQLVAGTDLTLASGGRVNNAGGTLGAVAGRIDATLGGALDNGGGRIEAATALTLSSNALSNVGGTVLGQSVAIDTRQQSFDNTRGTVSAGSTLSVLSGTLTNVAGRLQAAGALTVDSHGQAIANTSGGNILGQSSVALTAGALDNSSGLIASADALGLSASRLANLNGHLSAQNGMTLTSGALLDNRGGDIQSSSDLSASASTIDNGGGLIRAGNTLTASADRLINASTNGADKGLEGRSLVIAANAIDNRSGALRANDALTIDSAGTLDNSNGLISSTRTLALRDANPAPTLSVTNSGGTIVAGTDLTLRANRLSGDGRVLSHGDLAVDLVADFVNTSEVTADRNASVVTAGNLSNSGTLQAGSTLAIQAASLDNTAAGKIAGGALRISAAGTLANCGLIDGGDAFINATTVDNLGTGRIYGNHLAIAAATVSNRPEGGVAPVIAARERLDIGAGTIDNRDGALLFSAGDLAIGGALDASHRAAGQAGAITNASATIEALGNLAINAASIVNQKATFATTRVASGTPEGGIALLDYNPDLEFRWWFKQTRMGPWISYIVERYLNSISKLLGGGPDAGLVDAYNAPPEQVSPDYQPIPRPYATDAFINVWGDLKGYTGPVGGGLDAAYRARLATVVNGQSLSVLDDSHNIWQLFINTIAAEHPEYIDRMVQSLAARGPLQYAYRQKCDDHDDCDYVYDVVSTSVSQRDVVSADSAAAVIRAGGSATINANALENRYSVIQSGGDMALTGAILNNVGAEFYLVTDTTSTSRLWHWGNRDQGSTTSASSTQTLIGSAPAIISAGGALTGSFSNRIDNIAIRQNAARVVGQTGNAPGTTATAGVGTTASGGRATQTASGTGESVASTARTGTAQTAVGIGEAVSSAAHSSTAHTASTFGTAPARITRVAATGTASGPNGVVASAALALTLPASRLMHVNPDPAGHYLVETDPAFASYRTWLSSDYLLDALGFDPALTQKRLGDGFYEQRLILEQVAQLTGRRFLSGYASDEAQYRALMAAGATVAREWSLVPGVALSEAQMARLTTDIVWLVEREVTQADGSTAKVLVPQVYARVRDGDLDASGALIAGNDVQLATAGDLTTSGTIAGRQVVALTADNIADLRGRIAGRDVAVQAANDLTVLGGSVEAERTLLASAGNNLTVASTTVDRDYQNDSTGTANSVKQTTIDRVAGLYVTGPGGTLVASAGNDLQLLAAVVANASATGSDISAGQTLLAAGNDLILGTVTERSQAKTVSEDVRWSSATRNEFGTAIQTGGDLTLAAGQDLSARAASVNSVGALTARAGRDLTIEAGQSAYEMTYDSETSRGGFLSSRSSSQHDKVSTTTALSSTLSGDTVALQAGQDIAIKGSNVVSDQGTILVAQRNLTIESAQETRNESHFKEDKESGIFGSGGVGFTIGSRQLSVDQQYSGTTAVAGTVGSTAGNVTLLAGQDYRQVSSDVLAPRGDIDISAKKVDIVEARETSQSRTEVKSSQSGLTVAVSSPVISAIQTAQQMSTAASQTGDSRMLALAAANTAMAGSNALDAIEKGQGSTINGKEGQIATGKDAQGNTTSRDANAADQAGGINVSISVGGSRSSSTSTQRSDTAAGSTVVAGGNISITAAGAGEDSDITVQGSRVSAGNDVKLKAEDEIRLFAAGNFSEQHGSSQSSSAGIGVSIGTNGLLLNVGASRAHGNEDGSDDAWSTTKVSAGKTLVIESGGDTTLKGAVASGEQVVAKVAGNLSIASVQDTSRYDSHNQSVGGSLSIGLGGVGGNLSVSQSKVSSDYASVNEQSGIEAGDGGFQIDVKGTTDLKGAVIASTERALQDGKNSFATGALTLSDIANRAEYDASSSSVNFGSALSFAGKLALSGTGAGIGTASGSAASTTPSGISGIAGNQAVRSGDAQTGIAKIFDAEKVKQDIAAQVQITQLFGQQASNAVGDYVQEKRSVLQQQLKDAPASEKSAVQAQISELNTQERVANVLIGAVTGNGSSALTKEGLSAAAGKMREAMIENSKLFMGVTDGSDDSVLTNLSGKSDGVRGDQFKIGGTRIDLDLLCGADNRRCKTTVDENGNTQLKLNDKGQVQFDAQAAGVKNLAEFIETTDDGKKLVGLTGGIQGKKGTLFGEPYEAGSWQDKLVEAFAGTHDFIGGQLSGLYDEGSIKRGMSDLERKAYDRWAEVALVPATPFAMAELLPPQMWQAISTLFGTVK